MVGHAPIVSLTSGDQMVVAAEQAFDMLLPAILANNNWRFCTTIEELSLTNLVPPTPWKSIYLLPSGLLKTIRVYPCIYVWDIYAGNLVYAQYNSTFFMEFIFQPDPSVLPPHFVHYFIYEIASYLALTNAQQMGYYAALEAKRVLAFAMCAGIEAQNRPQFSLASFPVITNRMLGTIIGNESSF